MSYYPASCSKYGSQPQTSQTYGNSYACSAGGDTYANDSSCCRPVAAPIAALVELPLLDYHQLFLPCTRTLFNRKLNKTKIPFPIFKILFSRTVLYFKYYGVFLFLWRVQKRKGIGAIRFYPFLYNQPKTERGAEASPSMKLLSKRRAVRCTWASARGRRRLPARACRLPLLRRSSRRFSAVSRPS